MDATTRTQLIRHDVYHLHNSPTTYVRGRVVSIGDAAHAMLPTMGQGANTSIEDGARIGRLIGDPVAAGANLGSSLAAYDHIRRARCQRIARRSMTADRFGANVRGGWPQIARNTLMWLTPAGLAARAGAEVLQWTPPEPDHGYAAIQ